LRLRRPSLADAEAAFTRWTSDPEVTRYLSWPTHESVEDTRTWLRMVEDDWQRGREDRPWLIEYRDGQPVDGPIGSIGARVERHHAMIGYALSRSHWGRGLMPEAVAAVAAALSTLPAVQRIWAYCDVDNHASARVLEKTGFLCEGTLHHWVVHPNTEPAARDALVYYLPRRGGSI
jgi:RimJ/RimL family protein N-acetyltransferase